MLIILHLLAAEVELRTRTSGEAKAEVERRQRECDSQKLQYAKPQHRSESKKFDDARWRLRSESRSFTMHAGLVHARLERKQYMVQSSLDITLWGFLVY